jgi:uncharacterized protein YkwD
VRIGNRFWILVVASVMLYASAYGQAAGRRSERDLFAAVNQARRAQGLPALRWDESLAAAARRHAAVMAEHGQVQHAFEGEPSLSARVKLAGGHFSWLSENVTQGPTAEFIHGQFMHSPNHRANMLDRDMDSIGVGVVARGRQLFAVEDFSQAR